MVLLTSRQHQIKIIFIQAVRIQFSTKVVDFYFKILNVFNQMDSISIEIGDPSLASAFNSRYNGSLAQHQGIIYDSNSIQQSGSPVSQTFAGNCKPESGYWHQASEYNVNTVSFFIKILPYFMCVCLYFNHTKLVFIITGSIWASNCIG